MKELKALIFDVDGTLADTERDGHRVAFNMAFEDAGLPWRWDVDTYGDLLKVTGGKERIRLFIDDYLSGFSSPGKLDDFIRELHQSKTRHFVALLQSGAILLRPGVERLIREARAAGLRLGIATTTTPQNVTALLSATLGTDSIGWFDVIAAGDMVPNKKPAPDVYLHALDSMGQDAADCLAFEDSDNGLASSLGARLKTIVTVNEYTRAQSFAGAEIVLDQLGEPGAGFSVLEGDAGDSNHADLEFLRHVYSR